MASLNKTNFTFTKCCHDITDKISWEKLILFENNKMEELLYILTHSIVAQSPVLLNPQNISVLGSELHIS